MSHKRGIGIEHCCLLLMTIGFQQTSWTTFKSTPENFVISLPSEPKQERNNGKTPFGNGHHIYSAESNGILYTISYSSFDVPPGPKDIDRILELAGNIVVVTVDGKLVSDKKIDIEGFPGREVRVQKDKKLWISRAYVVKERVYQLMTTQPKGKVESPDTIRFYESFKLINHPE